MKEILLIIIFTLLSGILYAQINIDGNGLKLLVKKEKIQELTVLKASQINTPSENYETEFRYLFDSSGNIITKSSYYNGLIIQSENYSYDYFGNILTEQWYNPDNSEIFSTFTEYEYNIRGMIGGCKVFNSDSSLRKSAEFYYDQNGFLTEKNVKEYFEEGEEYTEKFINDEKGNLIAHQISDINGSLILNENYIYDDAGRLIEINSDGDENKKNIKYEYDAKGNLMKYYFESYDDEGKSYTNCQYNYDERGLLTEEIITDNKNIPEEKRKYEFLR